MQVYGHLWRSVLTAFLLGGGSAFADVLADTGAIVDPFADSLSLVMEAEPGPREADLERRSAAQLAVMAQGSMDAATAWPETRACLDAWEGSTRIEEAKKQYGALLLAAAEALRGAGAVPFESELRVYLERAATLAETDWEKALFLLAVAESLLRDPSPKGEAARADALLREVIEIMPERAPKDLAYALRCRSFMSDPEASLEPGKPASGLTLSEAVRHLRALLAVGEGDPDLKAQATRALEALMRVEVRVERTVRFASLEAIRLSVATRNVATLRGSVTPIPIPAGEGPLSRSRLEAISVTGLIPVFQETLVFASESSDWRTGSFEIAEGLPAGWYALELSAPEVSARGLILVTDLEVIAFPAAGGWEVRVFQSQDGSPVDGAQVAFYAEDDRFLEGLVTDVEGSVTHAPDENGLPIEVSVFAADQPAVLPLGMARGVSEEALEVAAFPRVVRPGQSFRWLAVGLGSEATSARFMLPGGAVLPGKVLQVGAGWVSGEFAVGADVPGGGPIYFAQPGERWTAVAHLEPVMAPSMTVRPLGEPLYPGFAIYAVEDFSGLEVQSLSAEGPLPEYVRIEVQTLQRQLTLGPKDPPADGLSNPYREVFSVPSTGPLRVPLVNWPRPDGWTVLMATVHPLGETRALGRAVFALASERETLFVSAAERLVRLGDSLNLSIERPWGNGESAGDLVVYRETWQSRYMHRKRGTLISESDYMALPERSLLGAAKTDYELHEEGYVREEAERLAVVLEGAREEVSLQFSRPGYYRIEWDAGREDVAVAYPEGSVEVWVIPPDGDLKPFRAERPRLVLERSAEGQAEVLLLMDRRRASVLLRWGRDEEAQVRVLRTGDAAAIFAEVPVGPESGEMPFEAAVIGERVPGQLLGVLRGRQEEPVWELESGKRIGLRPGNEVTWEVRVAEKNLPLWWTFEKALPFAGTREHSTAPVTSPAGELRALGQMFSSARMNLEPLDLRSLSLARVPLTPREVIERYPELYAEPDDASFEPQILDQQSPYPMPRTLRATLPERPGSWDLVVFGVERGRLKSMRWQLSTELPVQISIDGPERLRVGDRAVFALRLRNSLSSALNLTSATQFPEAIQLERPAPRFIQLPPLRTVSLELPVVVDSEGEGQVAVRLGNDDVQTEEVRRLAFLDEPGRLQWQCVVAEAGGGPLNVPLQVKSDLPGTVTLAPGTGSLLTPLWGLMRSTVRADDDLLLALGDWVVSAALAYHGAAPFRPLEEASITLAEHLSVHAVPGGGWSYLPGGGTDVWLSCQIVAALELGAFHRDPILASSLAAGRAYLEQQLLTTGQPLEQRLQVLRAVSLSAVYGSGRGPTRLEARHFLDLFQKRDELTFFQTALLLQTAANFAFDEEVRLLSDALLTRYATSDGLPALSLSEAGLVYGILKKDMTAEAPAGAVLRQLLQALSDGRPVTAWESWAALRCLAADYYWRGDFEVDGAYAFAIGEAPFTQVELGSRIEEATVTVPLGKDPSPGSGMPSLSLDASRLSADLFALVLASEPVPRACPRHVEAEVVTRRHFEQRTLLRGSRAKTALLEGAEPVVRKQDVLYRQVILRGLRGTAPIELEVALPAGLGFISDSIQVERLHDGHTEPWADWRLEADADGHAWRIMASTPTEGDLRVTFGMRALWVGQFQWPAIVLVDRMDGTCRGVGEAVRLDILPADVSAPGEL